jgi:DNA-binding NarL/FixJ family response regulator
MARQTTSSTARQADPLTVLLASASHALRRRWAEELTDGLLLVEAVDRDSLEAAMLETPDVVVFLDAALQGLNGVDGIPDVQRVNPGARIVVLASTPSERQAVFALVAGARGYCDRNITPSLVRKAADVVHRGEIWIGRGVVPHLLRRITSLTPAADTAANDRRLPTRFQFLAPRERQIALLVGAGANNKEIAGQLSITEATVKAHLTSVFRKLNVSNRLRLALFVSGQRPGRRAHRGAMRLGRLPRSADPAS